MKANKLKRIIVLCFVIVPLLSSIISTVHLVDFFYLGNPSWISYTIAVAIEVGAVASFLTLSILSRLNKTIVWGMFFILFFMQVVGNVYFSYDWVTSRISENADWLKNFREMMEFFVYEIDEKTSKMILSLLIGVPIPLISVFLLKSTVDYLGDDANEEKGQISETLEETPEKSENAMTHSEIIEKIQNEEKNSSEDEIHISDEEDEERKRKRLHPARS